MANDTCLSPGKNAEEWARNLKQEDFQLLCLDNTRKPVTEAKNCHLAIAPNHAVVSRIDKVQLLQRVMLDQQVWTSSGPHVPHGVDSCWEVVHSFKPLFLAPLRDRWGYHLLHALSPSREPTRLLPGLFAPGLELVYGPETVLTSPSCCFLS